MKKITIALLALLLSGCEKSAEEIQREMPGRLAVGSSSRFKVERVQVFYDRLAYGDKRAIYVITDVETRQEFVGISGIGISELASQQVGKQQSQIER